MTRFQFSPVSLAAALLITIMPSAIHASTYSDAINALNPDAYYRGEEGAGAPQDTTAGAHHLANFFNNTYTAGPTTGDGLPGMGAVNGAYQFEGAQVARSGEAIGSTYVPAVGQSPRTVIAWVKMDTKGSGGGGLGGPHNIWGWGLDFAGTNTFTGWQLFIDEGFNPSTGSGTGSQNVHLNIQGRQIVGADSAITFGPNAKWHQIAVAFEGDGTAKLGDASLYVDGVLQTTILQDVGAVPVTGGTNVAGSVMGFRLGQTHGGWGLNGKVDEVSVHLQKLDGVTIRNLYNVAAGIPEPATFGMLATLGLGMFGLARRRRA